MMNVNPNPVKHDEQDGAMKKLREAQQEESVSELWQPEMNPWHKIIGQQPLDGAGTTRLGAIQEEKEEEVCISPEISRPEPQAPEQNKEGERRSERSQKQPKRNKFRLPWTV
ncbi:Uncharacterized protein APZ42_031158 [Daphnia magna]|uniref:Uncharacterized protein n=1 Tax=Daphnia magna TaxID=35525 RepID=A0A164N3P2_9CRUS|nr:Uncharacterized protein APZ42_031158 [Daphnia magna]